MLAFLFFLLTSFFYANIRYMDEKIQKQLKKKLEIEKKRLTKELSLFAKKDSRVKGNWRTRFPFFGLQRDENAEEIEAYENLLPIEHSVELRLKDVNIALKKIEKGKYGKCEKCKKEIEQKRLMVVPEARLCISCGRKNNKK